MAPLKTISQEASLAITSAKILVAVRYLLIPAFVRYQAVQNLLPNILLMLGGDALLAPLLNSRQPVLEVVLISRRSRSTFNARHKCACFSLEFDFRDRSRANDSRDSEPNCILADSCLNRGMIRPFSHPLSFKATTKSKKTIYVFLPLQRNRELEVLCSLSFDCACPSSLCRSQVSLAENAARLCEAKDALIFRFDGDFSQRVAKYGLMPGATEGRTFGPCITPCRKNLRRWKEALTSRVANAGISEHRGVTKSHKFAGPRSLRISAGP